MNLDLTQLQSVLDSASINERKLRDLKAAFRKLQAAVDDVAAVLEDDYQPKERTKPARKKAEGEGGGMVSSGRGPGRPKKAQAAEATPQEA